MRTFHGNWLAINGARPTLKAGWPWSLPPRSPYGLQANHTRREATQTPHGLGLMCALSPHYYFWASLLFNLAVVLCEVNQAHWHASSCPETKASILNERYSLEPTQRGQRGWRGWRGGTMVLNSLGFSLKTGSPLKCDRHFSSRHAS